ncbi:hypothetical protein [Spongiactinospora sp. TRM90649]|uniref:hypothetical protein n=1 Tax=Spongiactinospora sp. TRM90649 TaxID=3031114 RepID=UPI0023F65DCB|nr:hypothetical protein [Spongiactinospora sp. TRM90649]MDF5752772.1 hypothetical protein [Spongiactinospora sp. TRM90649]
MERRRWDIDERFTGIADGEALASPVRALLAAMSGPGWVTEDPHHHLLPRLRRAIEWQIVAERLLPDGVYEVRARPRMPIDGIAVQRAVIKLLATVAEPIFLVRQSGPGVFDCVTGVLQGDPPGYAAHGHLIRVIVTGSPRVPGLTGQNS